MVKEEESTKTSKKFDFRHGNTTLESYKIEIINKENVGRGTWLDANERTLV